MKIYVTTSDRYLHLIPVFEYLYKKYWNDAEITILCHEKPITTIPCISLGEQGTVDDWSTCLRKFFESIDDEYFIWMFEDTLLKAPINQDALADSYALTCMSQPSSAVQQIDEGIYNTNPQGAVGRVDLCCDIMKREHTIDPLSDVVFASPTSRYRLSTQPSIWNRKFLLQYLTDGMSCWDFETIDPVNDGWLVVGMKDKAVRHNEGVRKNDIYKLDLNGMAQEDVEHIKSIATWLR